MDARAGRRDPAWLALLVAALLGLLVWPYLVDGHRFGVGPDVPVYLWWTKVGAGEGLSWLGGRPGAPALAATLAGTLNLNVAAVTAALPAALGVSAGTAAAALVRAAGGRFSPAWWLAGALAGVFSVHLVAGYLANLLLAVAFLTAAACLSGPRRSWSAAALLLAGGGVAHPPFLLHAIVVLAGSAVLAWRDGARDEARDIVLATGIGGLVAGAGVLATLAGPGPIPVETSKDGYLRRAGLDAALVDAYRERFRLRAARYVPWVAVPLAVVGTVRAGGFLRRFLASWLVVMAVAIPVGWLSGRFPPDRIVTFGFAVPIAAATGLRWVRRRLDGRPWLAGLVVALAAGWMVGGATVAWLRQTPFVTVREAAVAGEAMLRAGSHAGPDRSIVVVVDDGDATGTFLAARAANLLRAAAAPSQADDVSVVLGTVEDFLDGVPTRRGDREFDAISRVTLREATQRPVPLILVLGPFYRGADPAAAGLEQQGPELWASETLPEVAIAADAGFARSRLGPSSGVAITLAILAILAFLGLIGFAYAATVFGDGVTAIATAPAFGAATVSLAAVALDALGLRLHDLRVTIAAVAVAGVGGLALLVAQRRRRAQAPA